MRRNRSPSWALASRGQGAVGLEAEEAPVGVADDNASIAAKLDAERAAPGCGDHLRVPSARGEPDDSTVLQAGVESAGLVEGEVLRSGSRRRPPLDLRQGAIDRVTGRSVGQAEAGPTRRDRSVAWPGLLLGSVRGYPVRARAGPLWAPRTRVTPF